MLKFGIASSSDWACSPSLLLSWVVVAACFSVHACGGQRSISGVLWCCPSCFCEIWSLISGWSNVFSWAICWLVSSRNLCVSALPSTGMKSHTVGPGFWYSHALVVCWLAFVNSTRKRNTWEEGTPAEELPPLLIAYWWTRAQFTVGSATPEKVGLGCSQKASQEVVVISASVPVLSSCPGFPQLWGCNP